MAVVLLVALILPAVARAADEAPAARRTLDGITAALADLRADTQPITLAAEAAAALVLEGHGVTVHDAALSVELAHRPGSLNLMTGGDGGVALIPFDHDPAQARVLALRRRARGELVIGIGAARALPRDHGCDFALATHPRAPADAPVLAAAAGWAWQCELFSATLRLQCARGSTRLAPPPIVRRSPELDPRARRFLRYGDQWFHDDLLLPPPPPGALAAAYLGELRRVLRDVGTVSWRDLARATQLAGRHGAAVDAHPALAAALPWDGPSPAAAPGVRLIIGDAAWPPDLAWDAPPARATVYVLPAFGRHLWRLPRGSVVVDTQTPLGDALVKVPSYDTCLGGSNGVVAAAILRAIAEQARAEAGGAGFVREMKP